MIFGLKLNLKTRIKENSELGFDAMPFLGLVWPLEPLNEGFESLVMPTRMSEIMQIDWWTTLYTFVGGLGLFFIGMKGLSEGLQAANGGLIQKTIHSLTTNRFSAVFAGLLVTCLVQSSSITTVMVVGFVNAGLMQLAQAIGVVLGANIGTTITGWLISVKVGKYALLFIALGVPFVIFGHKKKWASWGRVLFALGLIFLGLNTMSGAFKPLRTDPGFLDLMTFFAADTWLSVWATVAMGCLLTFVVQSSSAMLGITIALASSGAITFPTALALVLGENIGTTITAILAGVSANTAGRRAALAHSMFNVFGVIVIVTIFFSYKDFVDWLVLGDPEQVGDNGEKAYIAAHIAAGHTMFNVVNVILFLPFIKRLEQVVVWLIPDPEEKEIKHLEYFGNISTMSAALAIEQANLEIGKMADLVKKAYEAFGRFLFDSDHPAELAQRVEKYETITDNMQAEITVFLGKVMEAELVEEDTAQVKSLLRKADELESISDYQASIVRYTRRIIENKVQYDEVTLRELRDLYNESLHLFEVVRTAVTSERAIDESDYLSTLKRFNEKADLMKEEYLERVREGKYPPLASLTLSDIAVALRRLKNHTVNFAEAHMQVSTDYPSIHSHDEA